MQRSIEPEVKIYHTLGVVDLGAYARTIIIKKSIRNPVHSCQVTFDVSLDVEGQFFALSADKLGMLRKLLRKNMPIAVKINKRAKKYKFVGLIDHIVETQQSENRNTGRQIVINCSLLLPKILIRDTIINAPQLQILFQKHPEIFPDELSREILSKRAEFFGWERGRPSDNEPSKELPFAAYPEAAIKWILDNTIATNTTVLNYNGLVISPKSFLGGSTETDVNNKPLWDFSFLKREKLFHVDLSRYTGTIFNYILSCLDQGFYEVFFDSTSTKSGEPRNKMIVRPKPFTYKDVNASDNKWVFWENLEAIKINRSFVKNEALSQSDFEIKNVFRVYFQNSLLAAPNSEAAQLWLQFPIINIDSMIKYGVRELAIPSTVVNFEDFYKGYNDAIDNDKIALSIGAKDDEAITMITEKRDKVLEWYAFPHYESGQITVIGGDYDIGKKLFFEDKIYFDEEEGKEYQGVEYYIEETVDHYSVGRDWTTLLSVSRGAPISLVPKWFTKNKGNFIKIDNLSDMGKATSIDGKKVIDDRLNLRLDYNKLKEIGTIA